MTGTRRAEFGRRRFDEGRWCVGGVEDRVGYSGTRPWWWCLGGGGQVAPARLGRTRGWRRVLMAVKSRDSEAMGAFRTEMAKGGE